MSTRKGQMVLLNDVLDEAKSRALEKVQENVAAGTHPHRRTPDALAEQIGLGAVVFGDLKNRRTTDYTFDWDEVLELRGPHRALPPVRARPGAATSRARAAARPASFDAALLTLPEEQALVRELARFPARCRRRRSSTSRPSSRGYLLDVAAAFSRWYTLGNQDRDKRVLVEATPRCGRRGWP